jgi:hypothetical protein
MLVEYGSLAIAATMMVARKVMRRNGADVAIGNTEPGQSS